MSTSSVVARATVATLLVSLLAGCGEAWRATTYDPRRACEFYSGRYWESDGTCHHGSQ